MFDRMVQDVKDQFLVFSIKSLKNFVSYTQCVKGVTKVKLLVPIVQELHPMSLEKQVNIDYSSNV